ncbi:MAG: hypothetical protein ABI664_06410 [bacterium]
MIGPIVLAVSWLLLRFQGIGLGALGFSVPAGLMMVLPILLVIGVVGFLRRNAGRGEMPALPGSMQS